MATINTPSPRWRLLTMAIAGGFAGLLAIGLAGEVNTANLKPKVKTPAKDFKPIDHSRFDQLLQKHAKGNGVDYRGLGKEVDKLDLYLDSLAKTDLAAAPRADKLAFYINAYNAATLRMILRHYGKIKSIRDINSKFGYHQWKKREWKLAGEVLSLDDIENKKLRGQLKESRIHFAIVCASIGCPALWNRAYTAKEINPQLDAAARRFMASRNKVTTQMVSGFLGGKTPTLKVSRIFSWFAGDFKPSVIDFVLRYADKQTTTFIRKHRKQLKLAYLDYDWNLNDL